LKTGVEFQEEIFASGGVEEILHRARPDVADGLEKGREGGREGGRKGGREGG
jgi:hypothetical protein